jgi:hypothetical protein
MSKLEDRHDGFRLRRAVDLARRDYELVRKSPGFDLLRAAQKGRIYIVDAKAYFSRPGPRIVDSLEILAGIIHPKEFPEFSSEKFRVSGERNRKIAR